MTDPKSNTDPEDGTEIKPVMSRTTTAATVILQEESDNTPQRRKILLLGLALVGPMLAFTVAFLWLIFAHLVEPNACENRDLCLTEEQLNPSVTQHDYVVDFPAAQLVFIASWSSTFSFTLIGFAMAMYSYIVAGKWLNLSEGQSKHLPTPHQTSILLRVINTEPLVLIELLLSKVRSLFDWKQRKQDRHGKFYTPRILRDGIFIFIICVATSALIQAADTYLHIVTDAINFSRVESRTANGYTYSRGLAPYCFDRPTSGENNVDFWSCGLMRFGTGQVKTLGPVNFVEGQAAASGISTIHDIWHYNRTSQESIAVVAPKDADGTVDFHASSFGVSTACRAIQQQACEQDLVGNRTRFNCTQERGGIDVSFTMARTKYSSSYLDGWHKFLKEPPPFQGREAYEATDEMWDAAANLSESDAIDVFQNPWQSIVSLNVNDNLWWDDRDPHDPRFFQDELYGSSVLFLTCNTTVYDVDYTAVMRNITSIQRTPSNSSTAGIVSAPTVNMFKFFSTLPGGLVDQLNYLARSVDDDVNLYAQKISESYAAMLAAQTTPRPALSVQHRNTHVYSKIPKAAVWLQVTVNVLFMILGLAITVVAFVRAKDSSDVHQAQVRLSITGLAAHAFEGLHARRRARTEEKLFQRNSGLTGGVVKRVALAKSAEGGSTFVLRQEWEDTP